jgi:ankyrin repeat protein
MTHSLPDKPNLDLLKKQAKKLLKQYRGDDPEAVALVASNHPEPASFSGLRDAQLVIARRYGFRGWSELSEAVELAADTAGSLSDKAARFIRLGCVQYSGNDTLRNYERARRLLAANPEIASFSFYTALVASHAGVVSAFLESDPSLATTTGGPLNWPALLYVTYSRIGEASDDRDSLAIARQLLDFGVSPDSHVILNNTYRFTALTGAMGEGEQGVNQPPHQYADEMAALLLDAGANPNDGQGLYNTMFTDSADKWLALLLNKGLSAADSLNWNAASQDASLATLDYQLASAVDSNRLERVQLLLGAGANPNCRNSYNGRAIHTNALLAGHNEIAQLLLQHGANAEALDASDQFRIACVREDKAAIEKLLAAHPELTQDASLLHAAAEHASLSVVKRLITAGFDVDGLSKHGRTLLHHFALKNDVAAIENLLSHGASTDILDRSHNSSPAGFAAYSGCYEAMRLLLDQSDSLLDVVCCGYLERAQAIVALAPESIHHTTERGNTVLHVIGIWLHDEPDYAKYKSFVKWLLSAGADINAKNGQGQTPVEFNQALGAENLADVLGEYG